MTPPGANVTAEVPGGLAITSTDSTDTLVSYYEGALGRLGATQVEAVRAGGDWYYHGTFDGGKTIEVTISGEFIAVAWDE